MKIGVTLLRTNRAPCGVSITISRFNDSPRIAACAGRALGEIELP